MQNPYLFNTINQLIESQAERCSSAPSILAPDGDPLTYGDLCQRVRQIVRDLHSADIQRQDRVAIVLPNGVDMAVTLLGVAATATAVPLNPAYSTRECEGYLSEMGVRLLVSRAEGMWAACSAAQKLGIPVLELGTGRGDPAPAPADAAPDDVALLLMTSGSTARPRIVPLTHRNVCSSARDICRNLQLGPEDRCLSIWQQFHVGGLVDLLLAPLASGGSIICAADFTADQVFNLIRQFRPTWYQAVPTTWFELLASARRSGGAPFESSLRFVRSVAAELTPAVMAQVEALFGVPVIQTFGMTEAAPLITSNALPPGKRKPGSVGASVGPEVGIMDEDGHLVSPGRLGEVVARGDNIMSGYVDLPEVNAVAFRHGWFHTGDLGFLDNDGYLFLKGRIKEIINRGGEKIAPREVDEVLLEHPAAAEAVTFPIAHRTLGEDVAAAVVLRPGAAAGVQDLKAFVAARLAAFKVPQRIAIVDAIPRGPTGKVRRGGLAAELKLDVAVEYVAPDSPLETALAAIWCDIFEVPRVGRHDNFFELGGHSLLAVRLIAEIETRLGVRFPAAALPGIATVADMAGVLASPGGWPESAPPARAEPIAPEALRVMFTVMAGGEIPAVSPDSLVKRIHSKGSRTPLFWCFNAPDREMPSLAAHLGEQQPLYGMYSGSGALPESPELQRAIATHYASELLAINPAGPFWIGGNCLGARVATELAFQLLVRGKVVERLCLLEHFDARLYEYPGRLLLLYGTRSEMKAYRGLRWGRPGWRRAFQSNPDVDWVSGAHGEFFNGGNVDQLAARIARFLDAGAAGLSSASAVQTYYWLARGTAHDLMRPVRLRLSRINA